MYTWRIRSVIASTQGLSASYGVSVGLLGSRQKRLLYL
jgi:hypothetical protein